MTRWGIAATAVIASFAAQAADLGPPVRKEPVYAPTWTGFYIGGSAGVGWSNSEVDLVASPSTNCAACLFPSTDPSQVAAVPPTLFTHPRGALLGAQIGYNYQAGALVVGVETDLSWSNINGTDTQPSGPVFFDSVALGTLAPLFANATAEQRLKYFGTLRARIGFLPTDSLLVFATGGLAYGHMTSSAALSETGNIAGIILATSSGLGSASTTRAGFTVGGGLEYGFARNWSLKAEYLYFNLGSMSYPLATTNLNGTFFGFPFLIAPGAAVTATTSNFTGNIVRVGVNYRFGY